MYIYNKTVHYKDFVHVSNCLLLLLSSDSLRISDLADEFDDVCVIIAIFSRQPILITKVYVQPHHFTGVNINTKCIPLLSTIRDQNAVTGPQ